MSLSQMKDSLFALILDQLSLQDVDSLIASANNRLRTKIKLWAMQKFGHGDVLLDDPEFAKKVISVDVAFEKFKDMVFGARENSSKMHEPHRQAQIHLVKLIGFCECGLPFACLFGSKLYIKLYLSKIKSDSLTADSIGEIMKTCDDWIIDMVAEKCKNYEKIFEQAARHGRIDVIKKYEKHLTLDSFRQCIKCAAAYNIETFDYLSKFKFYSQQILSECLIAAIKFHKNDFVKKHLENVLKDQIGNLIEACAETNNTEILDLLFELKPQHFTAKILEKSLELACQGGQLALVKKIENMGARFNNRCVKRALLNHLDILQYMESKEYSWRTMAIGLYEVVRLFEGACANHVFSGCTFYERTYILIQIIVNENENIFKQIYSEENVDADLVKKFASAKQVKPICKFLGVEPTGKYVVLPDYIAEILEN